MSDAPKKIPSQEHEELRIKIAELRGWTQCRPRASHLDYPWISGINPNPDKILVVVPADGVSQPREATPSDYGFETLPDYFGDLNVMHREWLTLGVGQHQVFQVALHRKVYEDGFTPDNPRRSVFNATAAQRAYAFYETIKP